MVSSVVAAMRTWTGAGGSSYWSASVNRSPAGSPVSGDELIFPGGTLDTFWNGSGINLSAVGSGDSLGGITILPDGKIAAGGGSGFGSGPTKFSMTRYLTNGVLDNSFETGNMRTQQPGPTRMGFIEFHIRRNSDRGIFILTMAKKFSVASLARGCLKARSASGV